MIIVKACFKIKPISAFWKLGSKQKFAFDSQRHNYKEYLKHHKIGKEENSVPYV